MWKVQNNTNVEDNLHEWFLVTVRNYRAQQQSEATRQYRGLRCLEEVSFSAGWRINGLNWNSSQY